MDTVEQDRALIKPMNLELAETALLCVRFQDESIPLDAPSFLSLDNEIAHDDSKGIQWRVDTKALARKLTAASTSQRRALTRAIFRFWERYPSSNPAEAMRNSGLV